MPKEPPALPAQTSDTVESFQPADGFIRYLKLHFWFYLLLIDVAIVAVWLVVTIKWPTVGAILAVPALLIAVVPDVIAFSAIHLRYDTTWYVMTDRSLRIRRGIWIIHETTITFENVQNVSINQGPIQRWFGIADVLIETAGGGGQRHETSGAMLSHKGLIEGVADAHLRDKLLVRLKQSRTTGLGEDDIGGEAPMWTAEHIAVLREIRDAIRSRTRTSGGAST